MIWSISGYKQFNKCQRRWYYSNIVADARVKKDPYRKEITILSKLQSVEAWRGSIVDDIISRLLVNAINNKFPIDKGYYLEQAIFSFDKQLEYATFQKYREPGRKTSEDTDFACLLKTDNGEEISSSEIKNAKQDITFALSNLLDDKPFIDYLKSAKYLISQRSLIYPYDRFNIRAKPDLIAFFEDGPPHIFDWKVHTFSTVSYDEQLISYAIALFKVAKAKPHADFPSNLDQYSIYDYKLTEYQLLHPERIRRDYEVTVDSVENFSAVASKSMIEMYMAGGHKKYDQTSPENFDTTLYIENCRNCPFKRICKQNNDELRNKYLQN